MEPLDGEDLRLLVHRMTRIRARGVWNGADAGRRFGSRFNEYRLAGVWQKFGPR